MRIALIVALCATFAYGNFTFNFESPAYSGSTSGELLGGQDGWTVPNDALPFATVSPHVYSGGGNTLGITNMSQFAGLQLPTDNSSTRPCARIGSG